MGRQVGGGGGGDGEVVRAGRSDQRVAARVCSYWVSPSSRLAGNKFMFLDCFERPRKIARSWCFLIAVTALHREGSIMFRMLAIFKDKRNENRKLNFPFFSDMTAAAVMFDF